MFIRCNEFARAPARSLGRSFGFISCLQPRRFVVSIVSGSTTDHALGRTFLDSPRGVLYPTIWYGTLLRKSPVDGALLIAQAELIAALLIFLADFEIKILSQSLLEEALKEVFSSDRRSEEEIDSDLYV